MIRRFVRWLRLTLPPLWAVLVAIFLLVFLEGLYWWLRWWLYKPDPTDEGLRMLLRQRDLVAAVVMAVFGIFRATAFHPFFRTKYRQWLELSPWTSRQPLPLGPVHLVYQDVLVLGLVLMCLHGTPLGRVWVLGAFMAGYLAVLSASFWATGPWWMSYVVLAGMGLAVRVADQPLVAVGVLLAVYPLAVVGRGMALARFPWPDVVPINPLSPNNAAAQRKLMLGWPFGELSGAPPKRALLLRDRILGPLLAAWWVYAGVSLFPETDNRPGLALYVLTLIAAAAFVIRLAIYIAPYRPPISIRGRIRTAHLIIPGYDCVFVGPLCTLIVAFLGWTAAILAGPASWGTVVYPLTMAAALIVALNMRPAHGDWRLTGHHRIAAWVTNDPRPVKL